MVFSGIVETTAIVTSVTKHKGLYNLEIEVPTDFSTGLQIGASVCVDGVCLTVSSIKGQTLNFDVMMETLKVSTLNSIKENDNVNMERSIKLGDEIVDVVVGLQDDIATLATVAAARPALGLERFMRKREATVAALAGPGLDLD